MVANTKMTGGLVVVVVVVVFTLLTDRPSTIPSNIRGCQSGTWSQRGTKVNGSHHGDNPLLRFFLLPGCFPAGAGPSPEEVKRG